MKHGIDVGLGGGVLLRAGGPAEEPRDLVDPDRGGDAAAGDDERHEGRWRVGGPDGVDVAGERHESAGERPGERAAARAT